MCKKVSFATSLNPDAEEKAERDVETLNRRRKINDEDHDSNGVCDVGHDGVGNAGNHIKDRERCEPASETATTCGCAIPAGDRLVYRFISC